MPALIEGPRRTRHQIQQLKSQKLRPASAEDVLNLVDVDMDEDSDSAWSERKPKDLDVPWSYHFRAGDSVWIRTSGERWLRGTVIGMTTRKGATREKEGLYYPVQFARIRKYFAPKNGEIKPDTEHIRDLLKAAGWLDEDDEDEDEDEE